MERDLSHTIPGKWKSWKGLTPPLAKVVIADEGVYALGPYGIWLYQKVVGKRKTTPLPEACGQLYQTVKEDFG